MSLLLSAGAKRRSEFIYPLPRTATAAPWNSSLEPCTIPTYDGVGATIHPSVVDMGVRWHGYRWWMANTPYANEDVGLENPCIWGSNDRLTWHVPAGLANPLVFRPGPNADNFNSDTELVYDPDTGRLIVYYRSGLTDNLGTAIVAQYSTDGSSWSSPQILFRSPDILPTGSKVSPTVWRAGAGDWRMWFWGRADPAVMLTAANPLGTWTSAGAINRAGSTFDGWHGDVVWHDDRWLMIYTDSPVYGRIDLSSSLDGINWSAAVRITNGAAGGWDTTLYRPTITPSTESGYIDCWWSGYGDVPGTCATDYVRLPLSLWPVPPAP